MLYTTLFKQLEAARWNLDKDIPWDSFDKSKISERQLHGLKMNTALGRSAMPTAEMFLRDNRHKSDVAAFVPIWLFEEQKRSLAFLEYLRRFAPSYLPTDNEPFAGRFAFDPAPALEIELPSFHGRRLEQLS